MTRKLPKYCYEDTDRYGVVRIYLRRAGHKKIRLSGSPWSESFMAAYHAALNANPSPKDAPADDATWGWLCRKYFASREFSRLGSGTRKVRRRILEGTFTEPREPGSHDKFKEFPLEMMTSAAVKVLRDRVSIDTPEAANERLKAIRQAFKYGVENERDRCPANPARDVSYLKNRTEGFYTWTEDDIQQYLDRYGPGTKQRRALMLAWVLGPRRQDACRIGRQHRKGNTIKFKPQKTEAKTGVIVEVEITDALAAELDLTPFGQMLYLETQFGKPYSVAGFGNWFKRQCVLAGLPQCSIHGLRKAGASQRAENGATPYDLMGLYGWASVKTAEVYTKKAQRKKLAARAVNLIAPLEIQKVPNRAK